jgi:hypothetical protein
MLVVTAVLVRRARRSRPRHTTQLRCALLFASSVCASRHMLCTALCSCTLSSVPVCGLSCCCCTSHAVQNALIPCARACAACRCPVIAVCTRVIWQDRRRARRLAARERSPPPLAARACRQRSRRSPCRADAERTSFNQPIQTSALPLRRHRCAAAAIVSTGAKLVVPAVLVRRASQQPPAA